MATETDLESLLANMGLSTPVPHFPVADVLAKPMDVFRGYLATLLSSVLTLDASAIYAAISSTTDITLGDLDVIIPRLKLKTEDVQRELTSKRFLVDGVHIRCFFSPHNLPVFLLPYIQSRGTLFGQESLLGLKDAADPDKGHAKVVVEFSSPNVPSEFSDIYLRSTILGAFLANLHECMGCQVVRINYIGDWGKQIAQLAVGWQRHGSEEALAADPIGHLLEIKARIDEEIKPEVKAIKEASESETKADTVRQLTSQGIVGERDAFFRQMEDGDAAALALCQRFRGLAVDNLQAGYERLGVRFDDYLFESQVKPETMDEVVTTLQEKGILETSEEGHLVVPFAKHNDVITRKGLGTATLRKHNGSTTYLLRDVAAAIDRERAYAFDKMLYVVTSLQEHHMAQVFGVLDLMGRSDLRQKLQHVGFGRIPHLAEKLGGTAHTLDAILDRSAERMREAIVAEMEAEREKKKAAEEAKEAKEEGASDEPDEPTAVEVDHIGDVAAISAILEQDMSHRRSTNASFDPKRMTSLAGFTGLKYQECHAMLKLRMAEISEQLAAGDGEADTPDYKPLEKQAPAELLRTMAQYPEMTSSVFRSLEPSIIVSYLHSLTEAVKACLEEEGEDEDEDENEDEDGGGDEEGVPDEMKVAEKPPVSAGELQANLQLYETAQQVLENGLRLLNIPIVA